MRKTLQNIYYFLPVQLLLLHFRKYQVLLVFWIILIATITGNFAAHFGAASLFLAPEYLGNINFLSMMLLGGAMAVFVMAWHITTFIIHSKRIPFMGATHHSFLVYCLNNSVLPIVFFVFYSIISVRFQLYYEHTLARKVLFLQIGFYLGLLIITVISFAYFFRVGRDLLKVLLSKITNPSRIREIVPYDTLDYEIDILRARTYLSEYFHIKRFADLEPFPPRLLNTVLRRHHRNAIFATIVAYLVLLLLGIFMEEPLLRFPAGVGFLFLFSITMGIVGSVKYFLKSWETIGWILFTVAMYWMVEWRIFDLRSIAYGLDYHAAAKQPVYDYKHLHDLFSKERYDADKRSEEARLEKWKIKAGKLNANPPLVVISVSGGGSRAAYWAFRTLQYIDSISNGKLSANTVLLTGASGGMIGGAYWRSIHDAYNEGAIKDPYAAKYQENIGKDLLNSIIFSLATIDLISPFNKISIAGYSYTRDRGYAMEQEIIRNTEGLLDKNIGDFKEKESNGSIPEMIINGTIINDGRKLMISSQPIGFLTQPAYSLNYNTDPPIDAVDFATLFAGQNPYNLRLTSALRLNATFPYILPVVKLPSKPQINLMDAGMRDNFGIEVASRYMYVLRDWMEKNTSNVIFLEIRDTREYHMVEPSTGSNLWDMLSDPLFIVQNKWEVFQSYYHTYLKDYAPSFMNDKLHIISLQYFPQESKKTAELNFHLTQKEKEDIYSSVNHPVNAQAIKDLLRLLN